MDKHEAVFDALRSQGSGPTVEEVQQPAPRRAETSTIPSARQAAFQTWLKQNKVRDLDDPRSFYDYRGAFLAGVNRDAGGHFPDTFKQHGHPTFSVESRYARPGDPTAGRWNGDVYIPPYKMNPALHGHVRGGLADTLATLVGRPGYVIDTIPDTVKEPGLLGNYPPVTDTVQVGQHMAGGDLSQDVVNETAIHETGHLLSYLSPNLPELTRMRKKGDNEGAAQAFLRAFLGLQATQRDTTNAEGVLEQFGLGIAPSLSRVEHNRGTIAEAPMHRVINELLGQPIFAKHPLQSRLRDFIQEWGK